MLNRNQTELHLPFDDNWLVFWGGDKPELNVHHENKSQMGAFDFVVVDESGNFYRDHERTNEASYSFGKSIFSPSAGFIVEAVDGVRDNEPGRLNTYSILGNYLIIKHSEDEFSVLAHLKQHSLLVTPGEKVSDGQKLALCGNSGHSTDAHLHYHLQDSDTFARTNNKYEQVNVAKGIKVYFSNLLLERNGIVKPRESCSPVKGDLVSRP